MALSNTPDKAARHRNIGHPNSDVRLASEKTARMKFKNT